MVGGGGFPQQLLISQSLVRLLSFSTVASADEAEHGLECPTFPWPHDGILSPYDHASIRRGHQVYQQVCASCHSMSLISYRDLVGVAYTEEEAKAMAAEIEVVDGPNDEDKRRVTLQSLFACGEIAMPKMLNDEAVEYEDGTPATEAQMGKDVVSFLSWAAEPEMEVRKLMGFKWIFLPSLALLQAAYYRRLKWSVLKSRKLVLDVVN
uniref:Cytochrome c domain-containing protein n=2 Tax=Brassica oleracea TaxID=3712 RepID=A0A0D3C0A7_BRAOL|nr:unnamed protein product [Brassica oleracea]